MAKYKATHRLSVLSTLYLDSCRFSTAYPALKVKLLIKVHYSLAHLIGQIRYTHTSPVSVQLILPKCVVTVTTTLSVCTDLWGDYFKWSRFLCEGPRSNPQKLPALELSTEVEVTRLLLLWVRWMQPADELSHSHGFCTCSIILRENYAVSIALLLWNCGWGWPCLRNLAEPTGCEGSTGYSTAQNCHAVL